MSLRRSLHLRSVLGLVLSCSVSLSSQNVDSDALALYRDLRAARLDGRVVPAENLLLERDVFEIRFLEGRLHLLAPVAGRIHGAVFLGTGSFTLTPATPSEARHLALRTGEDGLETLDDTFESAVLWFDDQTASQLEDLVVAEPGEADAAAQRLLEEQLRAQRRNVQLRLLESRLNETTLTGSPFYAFLEGGTLRRATIALDPMGVLDGEESCLMVERDGEIEYWYSSSTAAEIRDDPTAAHRAGVKLLVDAIHYSVESRIERSTDLDGSTTVKLEVMAPQLRVLSFDLLPSLRITEAVWLAEREVRLPFIQEEEEEGERAAVLFPHPLPMGTVVELRVSYGGDGVLEDDGVQTYRVGARDRWYPNLGGFADRATYDLTFRVPEDNTVIAVGREVETRTEDKETLSVWKSEQPIPVAGFNYGSFVRYDYEETNTGVAIEVYGSRGTPDIIAEINEYLRAASDTLSPQRAFDVSSTTTAFNVEQYSGPRSVGISTEVLSQAAIADAANSLQVYTGLFGPLPHDRLAITQQSEWTFGQAWPTLIYLPYLAALSSTTRLELGLQGTADFVDQVTLHEVAHQWWGHHVGWKSYRDQWLSEGFAEFSTAMLLELTRGPRAADAVWEGHRTFVLGKSRGSAIANNEAGPISLGFRASMPRAPMAHTALLYSKGAYVLHMLRMLMRDPESDNPDRRFLLMLRDFIDTFAGWNVGTEDLEEIVEEHMIPELDATGNGTADWFFDQWVYGTEVPTYESDLKVDRAGKNRYRIYGTVSQTGVSDDFMSLAPVYVDFGKKRTALFTRLAFKGSMTREIDVSVEIPQRPKRVLLNAHHDVLAYE